MKVQKQPNEWSCLPTAFAIAIGRPVSEVIDAIGHDGSEEIWQVDGKHKRRSFHIQELIDALMGWGLSVTIIEADLIAESEAGHYEVPIDPRRMEKYLEKYEGVVIGTFGKNRHAAAYSRGMIYDPNGMSYMLNDRIKVEMFAIVTTAREFPLDAALHHTIGGDALPN